MNRRAFIGLSLATAVGLAGALVYRSFTNEIDGAFSNVHSGSELFQSSYGAMEYAVDGQGPPVVMIHGTGGGFDQGLAFAKPLIEDGFKVIAPSRFGYLRTEFPGDPSSENQADAIIELMDHLGIERAAIIGGSAGALSALQVAIRHPERCSALIAVVPATFVPGRPPVRPHAIGAAIMEYGLQSDFLFWAGIAIAEDTMIAVLLATDPSLVKAASESEQKRARLILHNILPVSARSKGLFNDGKLAGTPAPMDLALIKAPTLAVSLEDDLFGTYEAAKHIANSVPGAKFVSYPRGGHVYVGHEDQLFGEIISFLSTPP